MATGTAGSEAEPVDLETAALPELEAELCGWAGRIAAATCQMLLVLAAFDRRRGWSGLGMASCAHWLAWRCGLSVRTAQEHVAVARALEKLPLLRSAFAEGRLSYSKVRAVTRVADAESERCWLNHALHCTASQLERLASRYRQLTADPSAQRAARRVTWRCNSEGLFRLSAVLTAEEGARLAAAIDAARASLEESLPPADGRRPRGAEDSQLPAISRDRRADADALVTLADGFLSRPAPGLMAPLHTLTVHLDANTLLDAPASPAESASPRSALMACDETRGSCDEAPGCPPDRDDRPEARTSGRTVIDEAETAEPASGSGPAAYGPGGTTERADGVESAGSEAIATIGRLARGLLRCDVGPGVGLPRAVVARLGCDALARALLRDSEGNPLALGRRRRVPTPRLRDAVYARDQGVCQYPGCDHARWLQVHHLREWLADEGGTDLENLTLLCSRHHTLIHEEGIRLERRDGGRIAAVLRDGTVVLPGPRLEPGGRPAQDLAARVGPVSTDAIHTHDGGRLSWDYSMLVLMQRGPSEPAPTPDWVA